MIITTARSVAPLLAVVAALLLTACKESPLPPPSAAVGTQEGFDVDRPSTWLEVRLDGKIGYIDATGRTRIEPSLPDAPLFAGAGRAWVQMSPQPYGPDDLEWDYSYTNLALIDLTGRAVTDTRFYHDGDWLDPEPEFDAYGIAYIGEVGGGPCWVNTNGQVVARAEDSKVYEYRGRFFSDGLKPHFREGKWGYINTVGEWVIEPIFDHTENFGSGRATVQLDGKWGAITTTGGFAVRPQMDTFMGLLGKEPCWVRMDGKWVPLIATAGSWIIPGSMMPLVRTTGYRVSS